MSATRAYYGILLTISDTTPHQLIKLLQAVDSSLGTGSCASLSIQADLANGSNSVFIGDLDISPTRYSYALLPHDQVPYRSNVNQNMPLVDVWVLASASPVTISVEVVFN